MTRDMWIALTEEGKKAEITGWLEQLLAIENGTHLLSGKPEEGRLCKIKKDLEELILKTTEWEKPTK